MKQKRGKITDVSASYKWTPRTSYAFLANKRRYPAELDDVTLAKHQRLERELERTKRAIDSIKAKAMQEIETQRKALRKTIHGATDVDAHVDDKIVTVRETNTLFRSIQESNANTLTTNGQGNTNYKLSQNGAPLDLSKERFQRIRDAVKDRLSESEHSLKTEKFKTLLRRPSSADMLRKVKSLGPLRGVRDVVSPQSDSCVILASKRT